MSKKDPLIILIGGTAGVGKTTIASELCHKLGIKHNFGTGFVREIARIFLPKNKYPTIHVNTYEAYRYTKSKDVIDGFLEQVKLLNIPIRSCIERSFREGTDLILEGNHLVPGYIDVTHVSSFIILQSSRKHYNMLNSETHHKRKVTYRDFIKIKKIENFILHQAKIESVPIVKIKDDIPSTLKEVLEVIKGIERN